MDSFDFSENNQAFRDDPLHGTDGPMWVEKPRTADRVRDRRGGEAATDRLAQLPRTDQHACA